MRERRLQETAKKKGNKKDEKMDGKGREMDAVKVGKRGKRRRKEQTGKKREKGGRNNTLRKGDLIMRIDMSRCRGKWLLQMNQRTQ